MYKLIKSLAAPDTAKRRKTSVLQVARAVFWSFFGVRTMRHLESDAVSITPLQAMGAGVIGAVVLVFSLLALVRFILA